MAEARSNNKGDVYTLHWVSTTTGPYRDSVVVDGVPGGYDSTGVLIQPGYPCEYLAWDMVRFTANDGPCTLFVYATDRVGYETDATGLQSTDTLVIPFPGLNMGAQGAMLPTPGYWPMELEKIRIKSAGLLDYLIIYWPARKPLW
jgi:hypothetical protein